MSSLQGETCPLFCASDKQVGSGLFFRQTPGGLLSGGVVFNYKPLLQKIQVSLFQIEVCAGDEALAIVSSHPVHNLRRVFSEICSVIPIERLAILSRKDPNVGKTSVPHILKIAFQLSYG